MNNRIMAMLFALVAAMFISVVPVKADALGLSTDTAHKHTLVLQAAKDATCTEDGNLAYYYCKDCGKRFTDETGKNAVEIDVVIPKSHKTVDKEEVPATCTETGVKAHTECTVCNAWWDKDGKQVSAESQVIAKTMHVSGKYTQTATQHTSVCVDCGVALDHAENHTYAYENEGDTHTPYCTVCGYKAEPTAHVDGKTDGNCICNDCGAALAHNWADWGKDENGHWKSCLNGNCKETTSVGEHNYKIASKKDGLKHTKTCKDCGYVAEEACIDGNEDCKCDTCKYAIKHDKSWARMESVYQDPTCTETGLMQHYKCKFCGLLLNINNEVTTLEAVTSEALGHEYQKAISCDEENHYYRCARNGCTDKNQAAAHELVYTSNHNGTHSGECKVCKRKPVAAQNLEHLDVNKDCVCDDCKVNLDHKLVDVLAVEPACEKAGVVAHKKCETCGKLFSKVDGRELKAEEVVRAALVHTPNTKWEKDEEGFHYQWCANNCGTKLLKEEHKASDWKEYPSEKTKHFKQCTVCFRTLETEAHNFAYEAVNENYHKPTCETCGNEYSWIKHADADNDCICDDCGSLMVHDRDDLDYTARRNPTCTENGNVGYYTCKTCARNFEKDGNAFVVYEKDVVLKALDHAWEEGTEIDSATGKHIESCEREGCKAVRAFAHTDKDGDCKCDINNCGKLIHSHKLVFHNPVPASCGKTGVDAYYTYLECDKAMFAAEKTAGGYVAGAQISALPVTEALKCDQGGQWTPAENGNHEKYCTRCEAVVASAKHNFSEGIICSDCGAHESLKHRAAKPATCTESGNREYWYSDISGKVFRDAYGRRETTLKAVTIDELGHKETGWVENGANHMQTCQRPGCTWFTTEAHSGSNSCICEKCGGYKEGHKWALKAMAPATCTEAGHEAYYECAGCEAMYNMDYEKIEAPVVIKAHELVKHEAKAAACTEAGHEAYYECAECRTLYDLKHNVIKAPAVIEGHKLIKYAGENATCTEAGYEAFYFCKECDKLYDMNHKEIEAPVVIKALGHKMNSTLIQDVKEGKHYNQCKNCSYKIYNEHTMVLSDPNKGNYHQWMCACGVLEIEKHYDKNGDKKCDACAHNQDGTSIKVEQHDNVTVQTGQKDTVQPNKSWLQNWLESLNANLNGGNKTTSTNSSAKSSESTSTANSGSSSATNSGSASTANSGSSSTTNSGSASANNSGSSSTANSSASTNIGGSTNNGAAEENAVSVPSTGTPSTTTTVTAPEAAQASVIVQFVNWFLGLFGF